MRQLRRENAHLGGGHIYQGRYKSFPVQDESYLYHMPRYVEANPLRARVVPRAKDWPWSSPSTALIRHGLVEVTRPRLVGWTRDDHWLAAVNQPVAVDQLDSLRQNVAHGTPQVAPVWISALVKQVGMESTVRPRGRPARQANADRVWQPWGLSPGPRDEAVACENKFHGDGTGCTVQLSPL